MGGGGVGGDFLIVGVWRRCVVYVGFVRLHVLCIDICGGLL